MSKRKHTNITEEEEDEGDYAEVDEEEEDDEDYDDEEDDEPSKKKKKYSEFLDIEAGVDEDDEDEEEGESDLEDFIEKDNVKESSKPRIEVKSVKLPTKGKEKRNEDFMQDLEKRYRDQENGGQVAEDYGSDDDGEFYDDFEAPMTMRKGGIRQQQQYPTATDPKLFMVKCKHGKEREAIITILQKSFDFENKENSLLIHSAVALDTLKGVIYIEAYKESHVKQAISGIKTIFESGVKLVPTKEMTEILTIQNKGIELKKGDWVRIRRGVYKGDLGQIYEVDETRAEAIVKLIPRLEYGDKKERRKGLFKAEEFEKHGKTAVVKQSDYLIYDSKKFKDGFLYKTQKFNTLETKTASPTIEELTVFQSGNNQESILATQNLGQKKKVTFTKGDEVVVVEGDAKHLRGTVYEVSKDTSTVTIIPRHDELKDPLKFPSYQLQKHFEIGDLCKVDAGKHEGSTGRIVNVDRDIVILYSDVLVKELEVFARDITKISQLESTEASIGEYSMHDLVKLDASTAGVIVKMEKDAFRVLDNNGIVQTITMKEMGKKFSQKATTYKTPDKNNNFVGQGESIKVLEGPHQGRTGIIKHIFRSILFCHARDLLENSGVFAIRAKSVELTGVKKNSDAPQQRQSNFKAKKFRHPDTNKLVRINKGVYKGYMGTIREANESIAHVVLQTKFKTIKVPIGEYTVVSGHENEKSRTNPWDYSRSKTPHMGDVMTPSVHDGLRTPNPDYPETPRTPNDVWNPNKPNTPFNDRPITPSTSRTPFSTFPSKSIQTPMMSSYSSVNTPGTGSYGSSTTPGTYSSVNTPGGTYSSVNTPGGTYSSVNTPGTYSSVNTPGGTYSSINTPGGTYSSVNTPGTSYSSINTPISSYSSVNTPGTSSYSSINTPSSYSSVNTPGTSYSSVNTPGTSYSSVNTPGTSYSSINTPSYSSVNTPGTYSSINTPGGTYSSVNTPGTSSYSSISTPGTYTSSSTPGYYNPLNTQTPMSYSSYSSISTPGTYSSINTPGTYSGSYQGITPSYGPNSSITSKSEKEITLDTGIEISITQGQYSGLKGCVKQALSDQATIIISDGKEEKLVDVPISSLELTMPKKKEKVKIIQGEHKGTIGVLMGMEDDGGMGIVRSSKDGKGNILVVNLSFIAKLMDQN